MMLTSPGDKRVFSHQLTPLSLLSSQEDGFCAGIALFMHAKSTHLLPLSLTLMQESREHGIREGGLMRQGKDTSACAGVSRRERNVVRESRR